MRPVMLILLVCGLTAPANAQQLKQITNSIGMKLVLIHAGSFTMGSPALEVRNMENETSHEVKISSSYYLGVYEVTQDQYEKVMGCNPSGYKGAKNPVEKVSWDEAVSFCKKLSEMPEEKSEGREYRLPTEAEWEYACRAGSTTAYSSGNTEESLGKYAWFGERFESSTHNPVGEKKPNQWGLYDMHGNVLEWCTNWYADQPANEATDPHGPSKGKFRVVRGGSWHYTAAFCRSASRVAYIPSSRTISVGFRVALSPSIN